MYEGKGMAIQSALFQTPGGRFVLKLCDTLPPGVLVFTRTPFNLILRQFFEQFNRKAEIPKEANFSPDNLMKKGD